MELKRARGIVLQCYDVVHDQGLGNPLPFWFKWLRETGSRMGSCPRDAAARRRRGAMARAAYAMRKARCERAPRLPLAGASSCGAHPTAAHAGESDDSPRAARSSPPTTTSSSRGDSAPEPRRKPLLALHARGPFLLTRRDLEAAERRAAIGFFNDLTSGGRTPARVAVGRFPWERDHNHRSALTAVRCLELLPMKPCIGPVWSVLVGTIAQSMLAELSPDFEQVAHRAARAGGVFPALPFRGWRRRARLAGHL